MSLRHVYRLVPWQTLFLFQIMILIPNWRRLIFRYAMQSRRVFNDVFKATTRDAFNYSTVFSRLLIQLVLLLQIARRTLAR